MPDLTPEQQTELDTGLEQALASASTAQPAALDFDDTPLPAPAHHAKVDDEFEDDPNDTSQQQPEGDPPPPPPPADPADPPAPELDTDGKPVVKDAPPPVDPPADEDDATFAGRLKGKTKERFERMVGDLNGYREALAAAGLKEPAEIASLAERAQYGTDITDMVMATGASAEQFGQALDYLGLINEATSKGDATAAKKALDMLAPAIQTLAALAGVDPADVAAADPLAAHPDLLEEVAEGDISRKRALELAAVRAQQATRTAAQEQAQQQDGAQVAMQQGIDWLKRYDSQMAGADPTYASKRAILSGLVTSIRATLPPQEWPAAVQRAYASIPAIPAPAPVQPNPPTPPRIGSVRPAGTSASMVQQFTDPAEALEAGLRAAGLNIV